MNAMKRWKYSSGFSYCLLACTKHLPQIYMTRIVGASLSEPHTSVTSLRTCVCMLACLLACGHIL